MPNNILRGWCRAKPNNNSQLDSESRSTPSGGVDVNRVEPDETAIQIDSDRFCCMPIDPHTNEFLYVALAMEIGMLSNVSFNK